MKLARLLLALSAAAAVPAFAQALGTVTSVNGVATVTTGTSGAAVSTGAPIVHGSRVITTSSGSVTFQLANGCTVTVPPGHGVTVLSSLSCAQLQAAVQPVTTTTTTAAATTTTVGAGPTFAGSSPVALGWAALLGAALVWDASQDSDAPISGR